MSESLCAGVEISQWEAIMIDVSPSNIIMATILKVPISCVEPIDDHLLELVWL